MYPLTNTFPLATIFMSNTTLVYWSYTRSRNLTRLRVTLWWILHLVYKDIVHHNYHVLPSGNIFLNLYIFIYLSLKVLLSFCCLSAHISVCFHHFYVRSVMLQKIALKYQSWYVIVITKVSRLILIITPISVRI